MDQKDRAFLKRLFATFKSEAEEHVVKMSSGLIELEKTADPADRAAAIEAVFREVHSFKGSAAALNLPEIESLCQAVEGLFSVLKRSKTELSPPLFDLLHECVDTLGQLPPSSEAERSPAEKARVKSLVRRVESASGQGRPAAEGGSDSARARADDEALMQSPAALPGKNAAIAIDSGIWRSAAETVRIPFSRMDAIMLQVEELLAEKLSLNQRVTEVRELSLMTSSWRRQHNRTLLSLKKLYREERPYRDPKQDGAGNSPFAELANLVYEDAGFLKRIDDRIAVLEKMVEKERSAFALMADGLLEEMKKALMLPFNSLFEILPKLVRDLASAEGKQADLAISGGDLEMDRRILEEIKDPIVHLLRNCVDHGIEKPDERLRLNKEARGIISIEVIPREGNTVELVVADDGRGIDAGKLREAAVGAGAVSRTEAEKLPDGETVRLAFISGVSTSPIITDVSGRGLGLAIVRDKIVGLGGRVSVETRPGKGTIFRALLPVSFTTFRGILVRVRDRLFIIPAGSVERVLRVDARQIKLVENRETIQLDGRALSLASLGDVLEIAPEPSGANPAQTVPAVILTSGESRIAFLVDEILAEQEVLVKSLGGQLSRVKNLAGATILGNGKVVPILNPDGVMKSAMEVPVRHPESPAEAEKPEEKKSLLVIEDSVTARALLKGILESAGYVVKTAVDGLEGLALLKTEPIDLVVSDVDMPRMNGFDLTARIRADRKLQELPVVLVTALDSRADREHGIDVGANAYIVKSSFDRSNLLEVIERLV